PARADRLGRRLPDAARAGGAAVCRPAVPRPEALAAAIGRAGGGVNEAGALERDRVARKDASHRGPMSRRTRAAFATSMAIAALVHLLPLAGVSGSAALQRLYGIAFDDPSLQLLMQHRALLFG